MPALQEIDLRGNPIPPDEIPLVLRQMCRLQLDTYG
jgi:hypothetical protein